MTASRYSALFAAMIVAVACGKTGRPLPPLPRGPLPPADVVVRQVGASAQVRYTVPEQRGTRSSQQLVGAELWRVGWAAGVDAASDSGLFGRRGEVVAVDVEGDWSGGVRRRVDDPGAVAESAGGTLRYAVRLRDRAGRFSLLVPAADLVPLPERPAPRELEALPTPRGVRVTWSAAEGGDVRYNVYRRAGDGLAPEDPVNREPLAGTTFQDDSVETGERYGYVVRIVLADGAPRREGATSAEASVVATDLFPPAAPSGLVAVQEGAAVKLFWNPNSEPDLGAYRVYRSLGGASWSPATDDPVIQPTWLDSTVGLGRTASYRVTAVDRAEPPNESEPSAAVEIQLLIEPSTPGGGSPR